MQIISQAQMMYLDSLNNNDITLQILTNGGSIHNGNSVIDIMNYVSSDISTVNMGMCASMGAVLLGAGTVGKRYALPSSKTMIHQSSSGVSGKYTEVMAEIEEWKKVQQDLFEKLGSYCGKTGEQVFNDCPIDTWFTAQEIKDYGLIDDIIKNKPKK
jgi:ATP-dependent Clp protease protease subunit